ncbi:Smr/MutS family protein [Roseateles sp. BYS180W]|uniref:Smr/MutS family protein n=1 Tax=Roseateles rivi TaxID=3299028 RepID=A0ABW7FZE2_9BURK
MTTPAPKHRSTAIKSLQDLRPLKQELATRQRLAQEREAALARERAAALREARLFEHTVGPVQALAVSARVLHRPEPPAPLPLQREADEKQAWLQALSDDFDVDSLLETDDTLSYRRPEISEETLRKLRRGHWTRQAQLDLHGMRRDQAREALGHFIQAATRQGLRCVRVVHGKGLGSPGRQPVLKSKVQRWLVQKEEVLAFVQAQASEGGAGALVVLLQLPPGRSTGAPQAAP